MLENRQQYRKKFDDVVPVLEPWMSVSRPEAGFYLWPRLNDIDDTDFARGLFEQQHVTVLPGSYLSRDSNGINPGFQRVRMALVAGNAESLQAANRIAAYCQQLSY